MKMMGKSQPRRTEVEEAKWEMEMEEEFELEEELESDFGSHVLEGEVSSLDLASQTSVLGRDRR